MNIDKLEKFSWILTGLGVLCLVAAEALMWIGVSKNYNPLFTYKIPITIMLVGFVWAIVANYGFNKVRLAHKELEDKLG